MAKDTEETVKAMSNFVNNMTCPIPDFVLEMTREHRTLQQTFTNLCFAWIRKCAQNHWAGNFDGRNEHSCKKSAEIVEKVDIHDGPFV